LLAYGFGIGLAMSNELLYIVEGVDPSGRKFAGLYTEHDAKDLAMASRLNVVRDRVTKDMIQFNHELNR